MNNLFKGAALFIGGAVAGAVAALLLAPKKGEELRQELSDLAEEAKHRAQDYCEHVRQNIADAEAAVRDAAAETESPKEA